MKKILSIIFAIVLIFSCFAITAFATDIAIEENDNYDYFDTAYYESQPVITFSEDYKKMYVDDVPFSRFDATMLSTSFDYEVRVENERNSSFVNSAYVDLTDAQKEDLAEIYIETNLAQNMYRVELLFTDGSSLIVHFIDEEILDDYNKVVSGDADHYIVDFLYPEANMVVTEKSALFGTTTTYTVEDLTYTYDFYYVEATNKDMSISLDAGVVFVDGDSFYYIDYKENNLEHADFFYGNSYADDKEIVVHKITDEALVLDLQSALEAYYDDDYGIFYDDDTSEAISAIFIIILFAVLPTVLFVIFLIKAIRGKGIYKKLYGTVAALCMAVVIVFSILVSIIYPVASQKTEDEIIGSGDDYVIIDTEYEDDIDWYGI